MLRGRTYMPGFADELGTRLLAHGSADQPSLEVLQLKPEFADSPEFERTLRARVDALRDVRHHSLAVVHSVERSDALGLCLVSEHIKGRRVSELAPADLGPPLALDLIRTVTPVLEALNQTGVGVAHGALSASRIVVATDGRLVVVEHVLGWAIEALKFSRPKLNALGLVVPTGFGPARFDGRTDMMQLGFLALSALLRRELDPADCPARVKEFLDKFGSEHGSAILFSGMRAWLERAMQTDPKAFTSAQEAADAFDELPEHMETEQSAGAFDDLADDVPSSGNAQPVSIVDPFDELADETPQPPARKAAPIVARSAPAAEIPAPVELPRPAPAREVPPREAVTRQAPPREATTRPASPPREAATGEVLPRESATREPRPLETLTREVPPREAAAFNVADLRASIERRQTAAEHVPAPVRLFHRIPEWVFAAVSLIAVAEAVALMFMANERKPADASHAPSSVAQVSDVVTPVPQPQEPGANTVAPNPVAPTGQVSRAEATPTTLPAAAQRPAVARFGKLTIASAIDLQVISDGARVGSTAAPMELREGTHSIQVVNEALEFRQTQTVNIRNGQMTSVNIAIPNGRISLNATPWAEVSIDGVVVGETPMANYSLPIGAHEIVFRHPQLGERRQTIQVKAGVVVRVKQAFQQ